MSKKSFVKGAAVLAFAGLFAKVLGAVFRIPLTYIIGAEGMGIYQMAYPIYSFLLVISSAGLPVAISKMVSERMACNDYVGAHKVFRISLTILACIGILTSVLLALLSGMISGVLGNPKSTYSMLAIAPGLFFVSVLSSFRGYFQGMQMMTPTALSQIVEQSVKLVMGLWLASLWVKKGVEVGAAGAVLGVTLSEIAALIVLLGIYRRKKNEIWQGIKRGQRVRNMETFSSIIKRMISIAVPVTIGASLMPLVGLIDSIIVVNRLTSIRSNSMGFAYTIDEATSLYGLLTAYANPLINFPTILTVALAMSIVPSLSESHALGRREDVAHKTAVGIRITLLIGLPAGVGMSVLSQPIIRLLYRALDDSQAVLAGILLSILSFGVVFLTLIQTLTGILQGVNRVAVPVKNLAIGAFFKVLVTYALVGIPQFNVLGAAVGTVVCYTVASLLDFMATVKHTRVFISFTDFVVKPVIAVGIMGTVVSMLYKALEDSVGIAGSTMFSIITGMVVYAAALLLMGIIREKDFEVLPGGYKLGKMLSQLRILR